MGSNRLDDAVLDEIHPRSFPDPDGGDVRVDGFGYGVLASAER